MTEKSWEQYMDMARNNETRDMYSLEQKCRSASRYLDMDENNWQNMIELIVSIEAGRIKAIDTRPRTKEELESWRNYMMNR